MNEFFLEEFVSKVDIIFFVND